MLTIVTIGLLLLLYHLFLFSEELQQADQTICDAVYLRGNIRERDSFLKKQLH